MSPDPDTGPDTGPAGGPKVKATDLFLDLTPERVLESVEAAGLEVNPVCWALNAYENRVYEIELADRTRLVAKFYRPTRWNREQILEEHAFLAGCADAEIPVCTYRSFPDGETLHQIDGIFYGLMDRRGGRAPDELTQPMAERLGMLVGRLHAVGADLGSEHRPPLDGTTYVRDHLEWMAPRGSIPSPWRRPYEKVARALADLYDELVEGVETQLVHGDLHLGNILERDGVLRLLDFDDSCVGPPVQDVWLALPGRDADTARKRELLLEGYERFRAFDRSTLRLIEPLRGLRIVRYSAWIARRWHDPYFPVAFPHFGTDEYWKNETHDLEECLRLAEQAVEEAAAAAEGGILADRGGEVLLDNEDYFWDWEGDDDDDEAAAGRPEEVEVPEGLTLDDLFPDDPDGDPEEETDGGTGDEDGDEDRGEDDNQR